MRGFICGLAVLLLIGAAWAQAQDVFNITVTVNILGVHLYQDDGATDYGICPLGNMAAGALS